MREGKNTPDRILHVERSIYDEAWAFAAEMSRRFAVRGSALHGHPGLPPWKPALRASGLKA